MFLENAHMRGQVILNGDIVVPAVGPIYILVPASNNLLATNS